MEDLQEDLQEEVDALFEESDRRYFEMWHRIAQEVISPHYPVAADSVPDLPHQVENISQLYA
jgi:hypothetical protein